MKNNGKTMALSGVSILSVGALVGLACLAINGLTANQAHAAPPPGGVPCTLTYYYSDAAKTNEVGEYSSCPGGVKSGQKTRYYKSVTTAPVPRPPQSSASGGLPCEFLAEGCSNLPAPHH